MSIYYLFQIHLKEKSLTWLQHWDRKAVMPHNSDGAYIHQYKFCKVALTRIPHNNVYYILSIKEIIKFKKMSVKEK